MARAIITTTRVILPDDATAEEIEAAKAENPDKSILRASSLRSPFSGEQDKAMAELTARVRKLEAIVATLQASQTVRSADVSASEPLTLKPESQPEPKQEEAEPEVTNQAPLRKPKVTAKPEPKAEAPAKVRRKLSELSMEELTQRVVKRGGNVNRILRGKVGRARPKALIEWIKAHPLAK